MAPPHTPASTSDERSVARRAVFGSRSNNLDVSADTDLRRPRAFFLRLAIYATAIHLCRFHPDFVTVAAVPAFCDLTVSIFVVRWKRMPL